MAGLTGPSQVDRTGRAGACDVLTLAALTRPLRSALGAPSSARFVAVALGVAVVTAWGWGSRPPSTRPPGKPQRFASPPVVVMRRDTLTVEVDRGRTPRPCRRRLRIHSLWTKNCSASSPNWAPFTGDHLVPDAVGVDASAAAVRELVGDRAQVLTGATRHQADPGADRDARGGRRRCAPCWARPAGSPRSCRLRHGVDVRVRGRPAQAGVRAAAACGRHARDAYGGSSHRGRRGGGRGERRSAAPSAPGVRHCSPGR